MLVKCGAQMQVQVLVKVLKFVIAKKFAEFTKFELSLFCGVTDVDNAVVYSPQLADAIEKSFC